MKATLRSVGGQWPEQEIDLETLEDLLEYVRIDNNGVIMNYDLDNELIIYIYDSWFE